MTAAAMLAILAVCVASVPAAQRRPSGPPPIYAARYGQLQAVVTIKEATQRLVADCMAARGFAYRTGPVVAADGADAIRPRPFGLEFPDRPAEPLSVPAENPAVPDGYLATLYGADQDRISVRSRTMELSRPGTGCLAEAETSLLGAGRRRWMEVLLRLHETEGEALSLLGAEPRFQSLNTRWRQCMARAGMNFASPLQVVEKIPPDADLRTDPTAVADLECKARTGYLASGYQQLTVAQQEILDREPSLLQDWYALLRRQCRTAQAVLARPATTGSDPCPTHR